MSPTKSLFRRLAFVSAACALSAAGCGGHSLGDSPTISGQIDAWNRGSGFTLQALISALNAPQTPFATAPIDDTGHFSITLPGHDALAPYLIQQHVDPTKVAPGCMGNNIQINPLDYAVALLNLRAVSGTTQLSVYQSVPIALSTMMVGGPGVFYEYVDRDISESGSLTCTFSTTSFQETFDVHFGTGWNTSAAVPVDGSTTNIKVTANSLPDGTIWVAK